MVHRILLLLCSLRPLSQSIPRLSFSGKRTASTTIYCHSNYNLKRGGLILCQGQFKKTTVAHTPANWAGLPARRSCSRSRGANFLWSAALGGCLEDPYLPRDPKNEGMSLKTYRGSYCDFRYILRLRGLGSSGGPEQTFSTLRPALEGTDLLETPLSGFHET